MNVRIADKNEKKEIVNILMQVSKLHSDNRPDIFKEKKICDIMKEIEEIFDDPEKTIIVAESDNKICGVEICKTRLIKDHINLQDACVFSIDEICVDENYRKKGIGAALIEEAKRLSKKNKCKRLELNCWEFNESAMEFYINKGFKIQRRFLEMDI